MSTASAKKPSPPSSSLAPRTGSQKASTKAASPTPSAAKPASNSLRGLPASPYSARAAVTRKVTNDSASDAELESAALIEDLRSQLAVSEAKMETDSEEYAAQVKELQTRLDEAISESAKMEEVVAARDEQIEMLENDLKELQRTKRDQEKLYESERSALLAEKEEATEKEQELNTIITRLKTVLSQKDKPLPLGPPDESKNIVQEETPPMSPTTGVNGPPADPLVKAKDQVIETLQLDLLKVNENLRLMETSIKTNKRDAEVQVVELRNANTRLTEDNESFQLLLGKAAISGEVPLFNPASYIDAPSIAGSTLADELAASEETENNAVKKLEMDAKKFEMDTKTLREQNKALTLYINNIIERLLSNNLEGILNKTSDDEVMAPPPPPPPKSNALPRTPPENINISRTRSVNQGRRIPSKPSPALPSSIAYPEGGRPLQRSMSVQVHSHKRSQSDASFSGSSFVDNMNHMRGSVGNSTTPRQTTFFTGNRFSVGAVPSVRSSVNSNSSDSINGEVPSPPHVSTPSAPISGKTLRPLRLVEGAKTPPATPIEADPMEGGKGNRQSWMGGWFKGKKGKDGELSSVDEANKAPDSPRTSRTSIDGLEK